MSDNKHLFEQAMKRPVNFDALDPQEQWDVDKELGVLDWNGGCEHQSTELCGECRKLWDARFASSRINEQIKIRFRAATQWEAITGFDNYGNAIYEPQDFNPDDVHQVTILDENFSQETINIELANGNRICGLPTSLIKMV